MLGLEISQNSDVTYRFYDFHRKDASGKERELHLKQCFDVVDFSKKGKKKSYPFGKQREEIIEQRKEFTARLVDFDGEYTLIPDGKTFYCLSNLSNDCQLEYNGETMPFAFTENIFIPADCGKVTIKGTARIIISYVES
jgi:mannose-6-phosphate isomerase